MRGYFDLSDPGSYRSPRSAFGMKLINILIRTARLTFACVQAATAAIVTFDFAAQVASGSYGTLAAGETLTANYTFNNATNQVGQYVCIACFRWRIRRYQYRLYSIR